MKRLTFYVKILFLGMSLSTLSVKAMTGAELALVGAVAGVGGMAKDALEEVAKQFKTKKGREAVIRWIWDCGSSCLSVCRERSLADRFIPREDIEADARDQLVRTFQALQNKNGAQFVNEEYGLAEFILAPQAPPAESEYTSLMEASALEDPIFYVGFFVKENRLVDQSRLGKWGDNTQGFMNRAARVFRSLGVGMKDQRLKSWVKEFNLVEILKTGHGTEITDPIMAYGFGTPSGISGTHLKVPVMMVVIRGKLEPITQQPQAEGEAMDYQRLLRKKSREGDDQWYTYLSSVSTPLRDFKENVINKLIFPPKRELDSADERVQLL